MKKTYLLNDIPKLPDQDMFLLNLQNSGYSFQTIVNIMQEICVYLVYFCILITLSLRI
jgi:hypothetical protein